MKQYAVPFAALCFSGLALLGCSDNDNTQAAPAGSDKSANGIAGVWQNDQHVLVLEANGDLYLPKDNSLQGLRWEQQDDTLTFNYLDNREQRVTQASATGLQQGDTLTLTPPAPPARDESEPPTLDAETAEPSVDTPSENQDATTALFIGDYQRANQAVAHISGTATRAQDSELPANAVLTVALLDNQIETGTPGAQLVAKRLIRLDENTDTMPFRLYYLPDSLKADHEYQIISQILADGGLFYQSDAITLQRKKHGFADVTLPLTAVMTESETLRGAITRGKPGQHRDTFTLCNSDRRLLIRGPQSDDLLSAYDQGIRYPQQPRVATVSGLVRKVPGTQEGSTEAALIVESFTLEPGMENCQLPTAELTHTRWQLTHLETDRIILGSAAQVPFLTFNDDGKVKGHGSCNSLNGAYQRDGQQLALSDLASTRKACPTSAIENRYLDALKASDHFRIDGELLTLFDKDDEAVASFQSIYL
jgi:putative lipoprotein